MRLVYLQLNFLYSNFSFMPASKSDIFEKVKVAVCLLTKFFSSKPTKKAMSDAKLSQKDNMIVLGSASERKRYHKIRETVSDLFCNRCGKEIRIIPWRPLTRLYFKRQMQLHQQLSDRCPWRENA